MRILVIEDEKKTALYLKKGLSEAGYTVDLAEDGEEGLYLGNTQNYDRIILDVMLPKRDGWSVLQELRREGKSTLTLMLTARDSTNDKVKGLDLGADGYLVKPFSFSELTALIRSLFRRGAQARSPETEKIADLEIDFFQHRAWRSKTVLDLTPKEFALLSLLARRAGEVVSRTILSEQVWGLNFDSDTNVVDVHIRRLRTKVDDPFETKLIQTVRGMGYVLRPGTKSGQMKTFASSIVGRLTAWYGATLFISIFVCTGVLYLSLIKILDAEDTAVLRDRIDAISLILKSSPDPVGRLRTRIEAEWAVRHSEPIFVKIVDLSKTAVAGAPAPDNVIAESPVVPQVLESAVFPTATSRPTRFRDSERVYLKCDENLGRAEWRTFARGRIRRA